MSETAPEAGQKLPIRAQRGFAFVAVLAIAAVGAGCGLLTEADDAAGVESTTTTANAPAPAPTSTVPPTLPGNLETPPEVAPAAAVVANFVVTKPGVCTAEVAAFNGEVADANETQTAPEINSDAKVRADELITCLETAGEPDVAQAVVVLRDWALRTAAE